MYETIIQLITIITGTTVVLAAGSAQEDSSVDLLSLIKPDQHKLRGNWQRTKSGLQADARDTSATCVLPFEVTGSYDMEFEFTRTSGDDVVGVILPLERTQVFFELSGWAGAAHGLSRINKAGTRSDENPTAVKPGRLENGKRYRASVSVRPDGDRISIDASLDDDSLIRWSGSFDDIEPNLAFNIPNRSRPALATSRSKVVFHSFSIKHKDGQGKKIELDLTPLRTNGEPDQPVTLGNPNASMKSVPVTGGAVDLTDVIWKDSKGQLDIVPFKGDQHYYLYAVDEDRGGHVLALIDGDEYRVLGKVDRGYERRQWHQVRIRQKGSRLIVYLNGTKDREAIDGSLSAGTIGLYCRGAKGAHFRNIFVRQLSAIQN